MKDSFAPKREVSEFYKSCCMNKIISLKKSIFIFFSMDEFVFLFVWSEDAFVLIEKETSFHFRHDSFSLIIVSLPRHKNILVTYQNTPFYF